MDPKIVDRYLKVQARMAGTDNAHEREECARRMSILEKQHPGIANAARLRAFDERYATEPPPQAAQGQAGASWAANILAILGVTFDKLDNVEKFMEYLREHEALGRSVFGGDVEPDDELIEILEERVKVHRAAIIGKPRAARRRKTVRIDFQIPLSVWEKEIASIQGDAVSVDPDGAVALLHVLAAAVEFPDDADEDW